MTYSIIGHGSFFTSPDTAHDIDLLVVVDDTTAGTLGPALTEVSRVLAELGAGHLEVDLSIHTSDALPVPCRSAVHDGHLLAGVDRTDAIRAPLGPEWTAYSHLAAEHLHGIGDDANAARWALHGLLLGPHLASRAELVAAAEGTRWAPLAAAVADRAPVDPIALADAVRACERAGDGHRLVVDDEVVGVVYRHAIDPGDTPVSPRTGTAPGGHHVEMVDDPDLIDRLWRMARLAEARTWGTLPSAIDPPLLHTYGPGTSFPLHVDDHLPPDDEHYTPELAAELAARSTNAILLLAPADQGGDLVVGGRVVDLEPGDFALVAACTPHEVTEVRAGVRQTVVAHTLA